MLLQHIVDTLDAELDRWYRLRTIVAGLGGSLEIVTEAPEEPESTALEVNSDAPIKLAPSAPAAAPVRRKRAASAEPREKSSPRKSAKQKSKEAQALSGSIPAGPVVVSRAALAKEHAARNEGTSTSKPMPVAPPPPPGSLGSMIRALRLDGTM